MRDSEVTDDWVKSNGSLVWWCVSCDAERCSVYFKYGGAEIHYGLKSSGVR